MHKVVGSTLFRSPLQRPKCNSFPFLLGYPLPSSRSASHASEGRANKASQGPGKRLGAKRGATELVVPGTIIFRQRGTHWFPGENCGMGRDHTIFAKEKGYVQYYREKWRNRFGERKFIGIVFEKGMTLPRNPGAKRMRRLGLEARERDMSTFAGAGTGAQVVDGVPDSEAEVKLAVTRGDNGAITNTSPESQARRKASKQTLRESISQMKLKPGYQYRESNWSIGRAAERAGVQVRAYRRGDRWLAWRKKVAAKARTKEKTALRGGKKGQKRQK